MYCIIFHTMLYIPVLLLLNKHSFIQAAAAKKFITSQAYLYIVYVLLCNVVFYEIKFDIYVYYIYMYIYIYIYIYIYTHICIYVGPIYI